MSRPLITVCYTQSLDGRLATATGQSQWIGGSESVRFAHALRAESDAIMVGIGTVLADNPRLTVRHVPGRHPLRVVVDSRLRMPPAAAVLADGAATGTVLATTDQADPAAVAAFRDMGATVLTLPSTPAGQVDLAVLLASLGERGIGSVMVEGGAALLTGLLRERLADRAAVCVAPLILGSGIEAIGDLGIRRLALALRLADVEQHHYGPDVVFHGRVVYPEASDDV